MRSHASQAQKSESRTEKWYVNGPKKIERKREKKELMRETMDQQPPFEYFKNSWPEDYRRIEYGWEMKSGEPIILMSLCISSYEGRRS